MSIIEIGDVEKIIALVADASDPPREMEVVDRKRMLVEGLVKLVGADVYIWDAMKLIAKKLGITENTVWHHMKMIHSKFEVNSKATLQEAFFVGTTTPD